MKLKGFEFNFVWKGSKVNILVRPPEIGLTSWLSNVFWFLDVPISNTNSV